MENPNITQEQPKSGQFVMVWITTDGKIFSSTLKWEDDGRLLTYDEFEDVWKHEAFFFGDDVTIYYITPYQQTEPTYQ